MADDQPSTLELFWFPGTCSRVALVALEEAGTPFELRLVNRFVGEHSGATYLAINPKGKVPALRVDGQVVTESPAIVTYLARRFPEAQLLPVDHLEREIEALSLLSWFASGIHPLISRFRFPENVCDRTESRERVRAMAREQLERAFALVERHLADRSWVLGEPSILDVYLLWLWFRATGTGMDGTRFPRCAAHGQRTEGRPSVARVLVREQDELERIVASGGAPDGVPAHQVGPAPAFAH